MPPLARAFSLRRAPSASVATLVSLTKLARIVPDALYKRDQAPYGFNGGYGNSFEAFKHDPKEPETPPGSPDFVWKLILSVGLVLLGGVFAGLTLALMGSDDLNLRVLATSSDDPKERQSAGKVLRLLDRGRHWVLVVLLLSNVIVNESLPIFLDAVLGGGVAAVVVSTTMIVIFGEIIPQAVCVRFGLQIGGACAPFVLGMMYLFFPIAYPIAKLLDYVLGKDEGHTYKKAELKSFLQFHREGEEPLRDDEIVILNGVLSLNEKRVEEIMTPIADCHCLPSSMILDHEAIDQILLSGFSRIPIHEPGQKDNFIGMLLVKRLITYNPEDEWPVSKFPLLPLPEARPSINCFQALDYFQTGRAHLLLISNTPGQRGGAMGIVSLEDLIEEIIGEEIIDETDRFEDNHSKRKATRKGTAAIMKGIIERNRVINAFANSRQPSRRQSETQGTLTTSAANGTDGLLIAIDNGSLVAEPVNLSDAAAIEDKSREHGKLAPASTDKDKDKGKPGMSPIAEASRDLEALEALATGAQPPPLSRSTTAGGDAEETAENGTGNGNGNGNGSDVPKTASARAATETLKLIAHHDAKEGLSPEATTKAALPEGNTDAAGASGKMSKKQKKKAKERAKKTGPGANGAEGSGASTPSEEGEGKVKKHAGTERESLLD